MYKDVKELLLEVAKEQSSIYLTNKEPEDIFSILDYMSNVVHDEFEEDSEQYQLIVWKLRYVVTLPAPIHGVFIKRLEGRTLAFGGFRNPDGEEQVEVKVPYNGKYPSGFAVKVEYGEFWK